MYHFHQKSLNISLDEHHFLFNSIPVVAVWVEWIEVTNMRTGAATEKFDYL